MSGNSKTPLHFLRDEVAKNAAMRTGGYEHYQAFAPNKMKEFESQFIEQMISAMQTTGLWSLLDVNPRATSNGHAEKTQVDFNNRLLAAALTIDTPANTHGADARFRAIEEHVSTLNRPQFLEAVSYMIAPFGAFMATDPSIKRAIGYGVLCRLIEGSDLSQNMAVKEVMSRAEAREAPKAENATTRKKKMRIRNDWY